MAEEKKETPDKKNRYRVLSGGHQENGVAYFTGDVFETTKDYSNDPRMKCCKQEDKELAETRKASEAATAARKKEKGKKPKQKQP